MYSENTGKPKYSMCINCHERRPVPVVKPLEESPLLKAVKAAYRKHHLGDDSIGWDELSEIMLNALCNAMGDEEFNRWIKEG
jgi:cytochrome c553